MLIRRSGITPVRDRARNALTSWGDRGVLVFGIFGRGTARMCLRRACCHDDDRAASPGPLDGGGSAQWTIGTFVLEPEQCFSFTGPGKDLFL
eukprot:scaffold20748_cov56-Phaeocystis_antarctica.AAC.5